MAKQADLGVLRTAKMALDEQLIDPSDFDTVKKAFLKAQQIKAGMDAGFLREEDYMEARDAFLKSLDFTVNQRMVAAPPPSAGHHHHVAPIATHHSSVAGAGSAANTPRAVRPPPPSAPPPPPPMFNAAAASANHTRSASQNNQGGIIGGGGGGGGGSTLAALQDLPRIGKAGIAEGKKSMSGITIHDQSINLFIHMKTKSTFKWAVYMIDSAGSEVVAESVGGSGSTYDEFVAVLPENQCRYGVYDYAYTNADTHQTVNKLVFINWAPDVASIRTKMMYASSKDFFKGFLDGVGAEIQASEIDELVESEMRERVHQAITRK